MHSLWTLCERHSEYEYTQVTASRDATDSILLFCFVSCSLDTLPFCSGQGTDTSVHLRQYKADGTVFWNHVFVAALRNSERKIINYVGIQHPLDKVRFSPPQTQYRHLLYVL